MKKPPKKALDELLQANLRQFDDSDRRQESLRSLKKMAQDVQNLKRKRRPGE
ncbi:hypothetical protein KKE06_04590 [Candidatus Micrarchaeota archaeon]|nr:hypothetical protein [Candidatus Micrarchaeota archaeon]MBU1930539.1 hypothetical protein [Candidatus Micrarchaeota archaeon]